MTACTHCPTFTSRSATTLITLLALALSGCGGSPLPPLEMAAPAVPAIPAAPAAPAAPPEDPPAAPTTPAGPAPEPVHPPPPFTITATLAGTKRLNLVWPAAAPADTAHLLEDPDGPGPLPETELLQVAASSGQATVDIFLPTAIHATYRVAQCLSGSCVFSEPRTLSGTLEAAVGLIKSEVVVEAAEFGYAVAMSRNAQVLAVGAPLESADASSGPGAPRSGAVHLYERTNSGQWMFRARLLAPFPDDQDRFASALALSANGDVLAVGAPDMDALGTADNGANNTGSDTGGVVVFTRTAGTWLSTAFVQGSGASNGDLFGSSVDVSDDGQTLAVGATRRKKSGLDPARDGQAYVFQNQGGLWTEQAVLQDDNLEKRNEFGAAVALSADGNTLAVGDPRDRSVGTGVFPSPLTGTGGDNWGAVHLFQRTTGNWARTAFVKIPFAVGAAQFGNSVDLDAKGQTLLVGAPLASLDPGGVPNTATHFSSGAAFVYVFGSGGWSSGGVLRAPAPVSNDLFGWAVAISGDGRTAAAGAYRQQDVGVGVGGPGTGTTAIEVGAACTFVANGPLWGPAVVLKPSDTVGANGAWHGRSVALSGDGKTLAVGASAHDGDASGIQADPTLTQGFSRPNSGAVYLY